jgi:hypothetical protein
MDQTSLTPGRKSLFRSLRRKVALFSLCLLASVAPLFAALLFEVCPEPYDAQPILTVGGLAAMAICPIVAFRTGRLRDLLLSPMVGVLAGLLDLRVMLWLDAVAGWPVAWASLMPNWGTVIGAWVALGRKSFAARMIVLAFIVLADGAARASWRSVSESWPDCPWLWEGMVYSPAAALAVLLAVRPDAVNGRGDFRVPR